MKSSLATMSFLIAVTLIAAAMSMLNAARNIETVCRTPCHIPYMVQGRCPIFEVSNSCACLSKYGPCLTKVVVKTLRMFLLFILHHISGHCSRIKITLLCLAIPFSPHCYSVCIDDISHIFLATPKEGIPLLQTAN
jgi:hypothetical protein